MNARRQLIAALSEDSMGRIATLQDVDRAEQLVDAYRVEVLAEGAALVEEAACDADYSATLAYCTGMRAAVELLRRPAGEKSSPAGADATPALTVYRASHDSIAMGLYTTAAEARKHCETELLREYPESAKVSHWWREDEDTADQPEDCEAELFAHVIPRGFDRGRTWRTGYVVTPLEVAAAYDEEADE